MRSRLILPAVVTGLLLLLTATTGAAPPDPLRLVPEPAELVLEVKQPRRLVESITTLDHYRQVKNLSVVKDFFESTSYKQLEQLLAYFEKELGAPWPQLLDQLAGGGMVLAVKYGSEPSPALLIIQGDDESAMKKFVELGLRVLEEELARQEAKDRPVKGVYRQIETIRIGNDLHAARVGAALLFSNKEKALHAGLDLHLDGDKKSIVHSKGLIEARKRLPAHPLATAWLDMEKIRQLPAAKQVLFPEAQDPNVVILFGGLFNLLKHTPYVSAALYRDEHGFLTTARLPGTRENMGPESPIFVPPPGQPGSRPLLEPKGALLSSSYFMDVSKFWELREKIFAKEQVKGLENFDETSAKFLSGNRFSKLLMQAGPYQRVVVVNQPNPGSYQTKPRQSIPAFAAVLELREAEPFARSMETIVRGAALLAGTQVKLKLMEEKQGEIDILGYRFDEKSPLQGDPANIRFNFSPCIARVGAQYLFCSTLELCRELVDLLVREEKSKPAAIAMASRSRLYSSGGAELLQTFERTLIAQTVFDQGLGLSDAKAQVKVLIELVRRLGMVEISEEYGAKEVKFDLRLNLGK